MYGVQTSGMNLLAFLLPGAAFHMPGLWAQERRLS